MKIELWKQKGSALFNKFLALRHRLAIVVICLLLIPVLIETWNLLRVWQAINQAARFGVRFGVTGSHDPNDCPEPCDTEAKREDARLRTIYQEVRNQLFPIAWRDPNAVNDVDIAVCSDLPGYRYSKKSNVCLPHDNAGKAGDQMIVGVLYNYPLGSSLGAKITPVRMRVTEKGFVEKFRTARISGFGDSVPGNGDTAKLIVVTGEVKLAADDVESTADEIERLISEAGGYVVESVIEDLDGDRYADMQVRIPAEQFEGVLEQVEALASEVLQEVITRKDVTEEYVDNESKLRGLQATSDQLNELLSQAKTVEEALNVSIEQGKFQEQIEQAIGKMEYLKNQAAMATLHITLSVESSALEQENISWQAGETFKNAFNFLVSSIYFLGDVLIWAFVVGIPILLVVWLLKTIIGRLHRRKQLPK